MPANPPPGLRDTGKQVISTQAVVYLVLDIFSLTLMMSVLAGVMIRQWPGQQVRTGLAVFLAGMSVFLAIHLLALLLATRNPADPTITYLANLFISTYALMAVMAFFLIIALAGMLGQTLGVLTRAGLVLWLLFQIPVWQGDLYAVLTGTDQGVVVVQPNLDSAGTVFVLVVMLFYQMLTIGLAYRYWQRIRQKWLAAGLVLFQVGQVLTILPFVEQRFLMIWLAAPVAVLIGYGLIKDNLMRPLARRNEQWAGLRAALRLFRRPDNLEAISRQIVRQAIRLSGAQTAALFLAASPSELKMAALAGYDRHGEDGASQRLALAERVLQAGRPQRATADGITSARPAESIMMVGVPLTSGEAAVGVLVLASTDWHDDANADAALLEVLAGQAVAAIEKVGRHQPVG